MFSQNIPLAMVPMPKRWQAIETIPVAIAMAKYAGCMSRKPPLEGAGEGAGTGAGAGGVATGSTATLLPLDGIEVAEQAEVEQEADRAGDPRRPDY